MKLSLLMLLLVLLCSCAPRITINAKDGQVTVTPSIKADGNTVTPKLAP